MKIALAQMKLSADMDENYEKAKYFILKASEQGAKLVCFPEVQLSPFFAQYEETDVLEYIITKDSRYVTGLCELCKELEIYISPNFYIEEHGRCYDMSLLIDDAGRIIGSQKMVHVAQCPYFYEQSYYTPSEEGFQVFDMSADIDELKLIVAADLGFHVGAVRAGRHTVNCNHSRSSLYK